MWSEGCLVLAMSRHRNSHESQRKIWTERVKQRLGRDINERKHGWRDILTVIDTHADIGRAHADTDANSETDRKKRRSQLDRQGVGWGLEEVADLDWNQLGSGAEPKALWLMDWSVETSAKRTTTARHPGVMSSQWIWRHVLWHAKDAAWPLIVHPHLATPRPSHYPFSLGHVLPILTGHILIVRMKGLVIKFQIYF